MSKKPQNKTNLPLGSGSRTAKRSHGNRLSDLGGKGEVEQRRETAKEIPKKGKTKKR